MLYFTFHLYTTFFFFFFNDTATTEIYTLSLHDALPISKLHISPFVPFLSIIKLFRLQKVKTETKTTDRKSTRLNSSHVRISYAVFCLKKKKKKVQGLVKLHQDRYEI